MKVRLGSERTTLDPKQLIGQGGEACVYRFKGLALKVYHPSPPAELARRIQKLKEFPRDLPSSVQAPKELVFDDKDRAVGFAMPLVDGAQDLRRLFQRSFREQHFENSQLCLLFRSLHLSLDALHQKRVMIGDLNDGNVLFRKHETFLIDADSMQFGRHLCLVAHEQFLDPGLFGVSLAKNAAFSPETDWYAFTVLFFFSLLFVHPYGGVHPTLPTLLRRAEARKSVLSPDVLRPKIFGALSALPDAMVEWFTDTFDLGRRGRFPEALLELRWVRCACGLEHARAVCPACALKGRLVVQAPRSVRRGRCSATRIFETKGRILCAAYQGALRYAFEENGEVRREDHSLVVSGHLDSSTRIALCSRSTFIAGGGRLLETRAGGLVSKAGCSSYGPDAAFATNSNSCVRLEDDWLIEHGQGLRIGQVLGGQTWFTLGEERGFGFFRAGRLTVFFLFRPDRPGLRTVELPAIEGRLIEADASFDQDHLLVSLFTEAQGVPRASLYLLSKEGRLLAARSGKTGESDLLSPGKKLLLGGRILLASDRGLVLAQAEGDVLIETQIFEDTEPFVHRGAELVLGHEGSVFVVGNQTITQLTLS